MEKLSKVLWNLDWNSLLPAQLSESVVEYSSHEQSELFVNNHHSEIFESYNSSFSAGPMTEARKSYYDNVCDFFEFKKDNQTVGLLVCCPLDWSTYYVRSASVLPSFQGKNIIQEFFHSILMDTLKDLGVERIELDTSPSNLAMIHIMTKMMFNPSGTTLTDRWGSHIRFTKFLSRSSEDTFLKHFCTGVPYQLKGLK